MDNLQEIQNSSGFYKIEKVKQLYYLGYGENIVYMINLDSMESVYKNMEEIKCQK